MACHAPHCGRATGAAGDIYRSHHQRAGSRPPSHELRRVRQQDRKASRKSVDRCDVAGLEQTDGGEMIKPVKQAPGCSLLQAGGGRRWGGRAAVAWHNQCSPSSCFHHCCPLSPPRSSWLTTGVPPCRGSPWPTTMGDPAPPHPPPCRGGGPCSTLPLLLPPGGPRSEPPPRGQPLVGHRGRP